MGMANPDSNSFAVICTFLPAVHRAVSSANWNFQFCLWRGFGKSLTYIIKTNGLRTEPCDTPAMGWFCRRENHSHLLE